ncbi:glutathione S-transferase 2-like [Anticarsia gemmatalis]|uniref:glutathione S-transferase 2-like n=1 Tax=Anticarsia gemmatalis TaxID=129554 RepID=UPI003F763A5D
MSKVVFYYFNVKALGEGARLLLSYGGEEFVDHRVDLDEWPKLKEKTPFGQLPMLVIDGKQYAQSFSICRYLGNKYGLAGDNDEEAFEIDQNVDLLVDIRAKATAVYSEKDPEAKKKMQEDFTKNVYPVMLEQLNKLVKKNNGHIALGKLTWGDFIFAGMFDYLMRAIFDEPVPDVSAKYPAFKQVLDHVYSIPRVKAYADAAPTNPHGI